MTLFQHIFWGYEITYPDGWVHQPVQDTDVFLAAPAALDLAYEGPDAGQVQIRAEWNGERQAIEPLWNEHIGRLAGMLGAKKVGSAPWQLRDAQGREAEIVLPEKTNRRLWTGVLVRDTLVLHFMVMHPKVVRAAFEPAATQLITSLRFPPNIPGAALTAEGLPLPPGYTPADPLALLADIPDPQAWRAYTGGAGTGALQAFYLRELARLGWAVDEYLPYPGAADLGFARLKLRRDQRQVTLGIMPSHEGLTAAIVYKLSER